jgi:HD-like signal output (HDOD) protein/GGDEF domain-containing protein
MNDPGNTLDRVAAKACRLLSLPAVAMKVLDLTESSKVDTLALKECLETDPALTSKVLRVVNSSVYGLCREVSDLNQALALLGIKPLKLLVLGFSLPTGLFEGIAGNVLLRYWRHTLVKAVAARAIAEKVWRRAGDEPFIAGLLQDLGALLLIQEIGEPYVRFLEEIANHHAEIADLERQSLGFEHTQLTAQLLRHWKLPSSLAQVVCLSETPRADEAPSITAVRQILRLAELVARLLADGQADALASLLEEGHAACGIGRQAVEDLVSGLEEKVQQLAETLNVDVAGGTDYGVLLQEAHVRLVEVAEDVAGDLAATTIGPGAKDGPMADILSALARAAAGAGASSSPAEPGVSSPPTASPVPASSVSSNVPRQAAAVSATIAPARLAAYVATAAAACRQARCPMSLMLIEMNEPEALALALGRHGFLEARSRIGQACREIEHEQRACLPYGEVGFLVILWDCERQSAVRLGQSLIRTVRSESSSGPPLSVSVGVASVSLPPVNFDPELMLESADRCLYGARASGGAMVKSIEIY